MTDLEIRTRLDFAKTLTKKAGEKAMVFFASRVPKILFQMLI
jgi:hypothetical protein